MCLHFVGALSIARTTLSSGYGLHTCNLGAQLHRTVETRKRGVGVLDAITVVRARQRGKLCQDYIQGNGQCNTCQSHEEVKEEIKVRKDPIP